MNTKAPPEPTGGALLQLNTSSPTATPPSSTDATGNKESHRQMQLRWRNCADLARNFWEAGFTVIVEHALSRREWIDQFVHDIGPAPVSLVVLAPSLQVTLDRDRHRDEKQVAHLFTHMNAELRDDLSGVGYWLDTAGLTVDQTVDRLLATGITAGLLDH